MTENETINAIRECLREGLNEDAIGHVGDLFASILGDINRGLMNQGDKQVFTLEGAFRHYILESDRHRSNKIPLN